MVMTCIILSVKGQSSSVVTVLNTTYSLREENDAGEALGNPALDAGLLAKYEPHIMRTLQYSLSQQSMPIALTLFDIDQEGVLKTISKVDRDVMCINLELCLIDVTIEVSPVDYFQLIQAQVEIEDINDNTPQFPELSVQLTIPEDAVIGSVLPPLAVAQDADSPAFGVARYTLASQTDLFRLDIPDELQEATHILLRLWGSLDREQQDTYTVTVTAYDGSQTAPRSGSVTVTIIVTDTNDNAPRFDNDEYTVDVDEDVEKNTVLVQVTATDPDEGDNGEIVYSFSSPTESTYGQYFVVNGHTGELSVVGSLDYENIQQFILTVQARNRDVNSLPDSATVTVNVHDVNDNAPYVRVSSLVGTAKIEVEEEGPADQTIAILTIRDADLGEGGNFTCEISDKRFSLQMIYPTNYGLITGIRFDHEEQALYNMSIACSDFGTPAQHSDTDIKVHIIDINDHAPVFTLSRYTVVRLENEAIGTVVLTVSASDQDSLDNGNGVITYQLSSTVQEQLEIDTYSGEISVKVPLDREEQEELVFEVTATDQGLDQHNTSATVVIKIEDVDDNRPEFNQSQYIFTVTEHQAVDIVVGQVFAQDIDSDRYNKFSYILQQDFAGQESGQEASFKINEKTGELSTRFSLDREQLAQYSLTVVAVAESDGSSGNGSATVVIHVLDINDMAPHFIFPTADNYTVVVNEPVYADHVLVQVLAQDADAGQHGQIGYSIVAGDPNDYFIIGPTGYLAARRDLQLENNDVHVFNLSIQVSNVGSPHHTRSTQLVIVYNLTDYQSTSGTSDSDTNRQIAIGIGVVLGIIALILVVVIVVMWYRQRRHEKEDSGQRRCPPQYPQSAIVQPYISSIERPDPQRLLTDCNQHSAYSNKLLEIGEDLSPVRPYF